MSHWLNSAAPEPPPPAATMTRELRLPACWLATVRTSLLPPPPPPISVLDPPPLNPPTQSTPRPHPPSVGAPPTLTYRVCPGDTATSLLTRAPRPPAGPPYPTAPGAPTATTWMLLTPVGTTNVSCEPVGPNVHVVVAPGEQLPAAAAGDAANADELAAKHTVATHIRDPTDATARLATLPRPQNRTAKNPGFTVRALPDSDRNRQARTRPRAEPPRDHPATPNTNITCLSVLIPRSSSPQGGASANHGLSPVRLVGLTPASTPLGAASAPTIQLQGGAVTSTIPGIARYSGPLKIHASGPSPPDRRSPCGPDAHRSGPKTPASWHRPASHARTFVARRSPCWAASAPATTATSPACNGGGVAFCFVAHAGVSVRLLLR